MAHDGNTLNAESAALMRARTAKIDRRATPATPRWLIELKPKAAEMHDRSERPAGRPVGRWLGDFLDSDTPSGLLPAEEKLLFAAAKGETCVLESRAARLWRVFDPWRKAMPEPPTEEKGFVAAMAKFTAAAPEAVQEVIIEATRHAIAKLDLPQFWEPKDAGEVEKFASEQRVFLAKLEAEANPAKTIEAARKDGVFRQLATDIVSEALAPKSQPVKINQEWLNPLLRRDPLRLSVETRARIEAQPRLLRELFDELVREVRRSEADGPAFVARLKADPAALKESLEAAFQRYERETWRWVDPEDPEVRLRASFVRFLALGGDDAAPVHERGLKIWNAYIAEDLDLSGCTIPQPLLFSRCVAAQVSLRDAITKSLNFSTSRVGEIDADGAQTEGGILLQAGFHASGGVSLNYAQVQGRVSGGGGTFLSAGGFAIKGHGARIARDLDLSDGFVSEGAVSLQGVKIGGGFDCQGGDFRNRTEDGSGIALDCHKAQIKGNVALRDGFRAEGGVFFSAAKLGGALDCAHGAFVNQTADGTGVALVGDDAKIDGDVNLAAGFFAEGQVRFYGAHIKGNVTCSGGSFKNQARAKKSDGSAGWTRRAASAFDVENSRIDGLLELSKDGVARSQFLGSVNLMGCHVREVEDHSHSWPPKKVATVRGRKAPAYISLDGFVYDRMIGSGNYDARTRKRWLDRQPPRDLGVDFKPQPFEQLAKIYREKGRTGDAEAIAKFKQRKRYSSLFAKLWHGWRDRPKLTHRVFGPKWGRLASPLNWLAWPFVFAAGTLYRAAASVPLALAWAFVGFGTAYWHGWGRVALFLVALWIAGGLFYGEVAGQGGFAPSDPAIYLNEKLQARCGKNWTACKGAPPELPSFSPFTYSFDVMLPVLALGEKRDWRPIERADRPVQLDLPAFTWLSVNDLRHSEIPEVSIKPQPIGEGTLDTIVKVQMVLSWAALGLLIAMLSGVIKKD